MAAEPIIPPLEEEQWSPEQKQVFSYLNQVDEDGKAPLNMLSTIAHHPEIFEVFIPMGARLGATTKIDKRDLELLALRASWHGQSEYELEHHRSFGLKAGLTEAEMDSLVTEAPEADFNERELLIIYAVDEYVTGTQLSAATMAKLLDEYSEAEVIEILFIINQYYGMSKFANSLGIQLEPGYMKQE